MTRLNVRAHGKTDKGRVRTSNEDALLLDPEIGLFGVFDGMGGAMAGEVASATARAIVSEHGRKHHGATPPRELLGEAMQKASSAIYREARTNPARRGMGTTAVAVMIKDAASAVVAHVGDSRCYLLRDGRLQLLTRDHTVVTELLANKAITPAEAVHHPYKNVLSRNLGGKPRAKVDIVEIRLQPGDRLLICSDGLTNFASSDAIEHVLGGAEDPAHATQDLVDLALRGGGGDNVTALVIEAGQAVVPESTQLIRTEGARAWSERRDLFLRVASERGLARSPLCARLSAMEAVDLVAGNLTDAVFHDLQQTTGINVWTFAENLSKAWLERGGAYETLRDLWDILRAAADIVIADVLATDKPYAVQLEIAVMRSMIVAEMAIAGLLAERVRAVETDLAQLQARQAVADAGDTAANLFPDQPTVPFMRAGRSEAPSPAVIDCLEAARVAARQALADTGERPGTTECLDRAHQTAVDPAGLDEGEVTARDLLSLSAFDGMGVTPLLDALDQARDVHLEAIKRFQGSRQVRAAGLRRAAIAHRRILYGVVAAIVESARPISEALVEAQAETAKLRTQVGQGETRLTELEREYVGRQQGTTGITKTGVAPP